MSHKELCVCLSRACDSFIQKSPSQREREGGRVATTHLPCQTWGQPLCLSSSHLILSYMALTDEFADSAVRDWTPLENQDTTWENKENPTSNFSTSGVLAQFQQLSPGKTQQKVIFCCVDGTVTFGWSRGPHPCLSVILLSSDLLS